MRGQLPTGARAGVTSLAALATAALVSLGAAPAAFAHNVLTGSTPEDGETVDTVPDEVVLTFNEEVLEGGNAIVVTGPDGDNHAAEEVRLGDNEAAVDLAPLTEAGDYDIQYRIVSADGHIIEGTLDFSVTDDAVADVAAAPGEDDDVADSEEPVEVEPSPAGQQDDAGALGGMDTWVAILVALGVIGIIVVILLRIRRGGPGATP